MDSFFRSSMMVTLSGLVGLAPSVLAVETTASVRRDIGIVQVQLLKSHPSEPHLFGFSGPAGSPKDPDNCTVSPQRDVQKVWFQDQPGTDLTPVQPLDAQQALDWSHLALYVRSFNFTQPSARTEKAAIIVVDDFTSPLQYSHQDLLGVGGASGPLTHGGLIHAQIEDVLNRSGFGEQVRIFDVRFVEGEKTSALNARIEQQIGVLTKQKYKHITVNMSFVVMSCGVLNDYKNWLSKNQSNSTLTRTGMRAYIDELWNGYRKVYGGGSDPTEIFMAAVLSANVIDPTIEDPLGGQTSPSKVMVQRVASAGNYGLPYALYPAALPNVIGVAATLEDHVKPAHTYLSGMPPTRNDQYWSNAGDVAELGQWLTVPLAWQGKTVPFYYLGTSFAAPMVSVLSVINALEKSCPLPTNPKDGKWVPSGSQPMKSLLHTCYP